MKGLLYLEIQRSASFMGTNRIFFYLFSYCILFSSFVFIYTILHLFYVGFCMELYRIYKLFHCMKVKNNRDLCVLFIL